MSGLSKPKRIEKDLTSLKPEEVHLHVFIRKDLHKKLMQKKTDYGVSIRDSVNEALEAHLNK